MLGPILCGLLSQAPLLPKLRGNFAEFLNNASPAGLRILSSSTCVGLRYGYSIRYSGFSRQPESAASLLWFAPRHTSPCLPRSLHSRACLSFCVPAVLIYCSAGISTCCPSGTPSGLPLGPDFPRADQLYPGNLRYSAWRIPTSISLLIPAFSLRKTPHVLSVMLRRFTDAPLPIINSSHGFGGVFQPRAFSAQDLSTSELLRTL